MKRPISISGKIKYAGMVIFLLLSLAAQGADRTSKAQAPPAFSSPALYIMLAIIVLLLLAILTVGESIKAAARIRRNRDNILKTLVIATSVFAWPKQLAAEAPVNVTPGEQPVTAELTGYWGLDGTTFFALCSIIAFELLVFFILRNISMQLLKEGMVNQESKSVPVKTRPRFMEKINASIPLEKEEEIMLDHEYDGIRELDNNLPPWWKYGFYVSIVFSMIYLVHYHVTKTGNLQLAEYEAEIKKASDDLAEYRKNAASHVTEANVTLLTDGDALAKGKAIFMNNCAACHGKAGEGGVGPNLTDDYWLHNGSIKDVFVSVKYGWPEKGMKAWEQDLSPIQMHQVASYIKSLHGTHPENPKEKQGELYIEEKSTVSSADSSALMSKIK